MQNTLKELIFSNVTLLLRQIPYCVLKEVKHATVLRQ